MARIIYALSGEGRGHTSRVIAISEELRRRGHAVTYCCGGTARQILESEGEPVLAVPALHQVMQGNEVQVGKTMWRNAANVFNQRDIAARLAARFEALSPDLLITDFEAFSPKAARRIGLPVLSFNHQQVVTETRYYLPPRFRANAALTKLAIHLIAPRHPEHKLLSSFFFPPLKDPGSTTLVQPIIRPAVQALSPTRGDHVLVYYNQTDGVEHVVDVLRQVDARFIVYNFPAPADPSRYPNIRFKRPSLEEFLEDLASSRAVLCTAGFTLISEALYLAKPLLVVPNRGIFEQTLNALFLLRDGLGEAVLDRPIHVRDVTAFLARLDLYEARLRGRHACGNDDALACIESVLAGLAARRSTGPPSGNGAPQPVDTALVAKPV